MILLPTVDDGHMHTASLLDYKQRLGSIKLNEDLDFIKAYEEFLKDYKLLDVEELELIEELTFLHLAEFFTECQRRYLSIKESKTVKFLLESSKKGNGSVRDLLALPFAGNSYDRVGDLSQKTDFTRCQRAVMVGCGPLPATLFWLYDHYPNIIYLGLDIDAKCVELASQLLNTLDITGIQILHGDGQEFNFSKVDFVFIANQVTPKKAVLSRILDTAEGNVQVVVRDPTPLGRLFAECVRDDLPSGFSVRDEGNESQTFLSVNLFLERDNGL